MAPSQHLSPLPQSRRNPLKPGGQKESGLIIYLDQGVKRIQKRIDNRLTNRKTKAAPSEPVGYGAFWEAANDLERLVDIVWVSGSPNLQIPYLLNIAVLIVEFLPLFDVSARSSHATFCLLFKLDYAFSSLLKGRDSTTGEFLPGFEHGRSVSMTDKVRLKGIVDRTRITVVQISNRNTIAESEEVKDLMIPGTEEEVWMRTDVRQNPTTMQGLETGEEDEEEEDEDIYGWEERNIVSVYAKTIEQLGDALGGPIMGIVTDDWPTNRAEGKTNSDGCMEC